MNIDDVFDKARTVVDTAAKKTEVVVNISKLRLECMKINSEIKSLYEKIGSSVYQMYRDSYKNDDLIHSLCEEVEDLLAKQEVINQQIADLQNVVLCPVCGHKNVKDSFYCAKCGAKIKEEFTSDTAAEDA